jgi:2-polyprenyl-3-methyl-5-hydroxy-6-metoxy-1,4-benzoquinol methylase
MDSAAQARDAFVERLMRASGGFFEILSVYLGDRLGFYEAMARQSPVTSADLSARTGTQERYVREWLEQQAVTGILAVDNASDGPGERRYRLPAGHEEVLVDQDSLNYLAPLAQLAAGAARPLDAVLEAFRNGGGVPFSAYGKDLREGQARMNRAMFLFQLGREWLPSIPDVHARLEADPPARIADLGCGAGWSAIGMAQSYPKVLVDGFDLDAPSIELAAANARQAGVESRVRFQVRDAADPALAGRYDLVAVFEAIHDMSNPVGALDAMRRLAKDDGTVLVVDERVADAFSTTPDGLEWMMYGWSVFHCLPVGMAEQPSAATGTVMRAGTLRAYARQAGFRDVEVLPIDHLLFRFYRLLR